MNAAQTRLFHFKAKDDLLTLTLKAVTSDILVQQIALLLRTYLCPAAYSSLQYPALLLGGYVARFGLNMIKRIFLFLFFFSDNEIGFLGTKQLTFSFFLAEKSVFHNFFHILNKTRLKPFVSY